MIPAYPKIFALGTVYIRDIFAEPVEVTEKVDGSQFSFGVIDDELMMRSKGARLYAENPEKLFAEGIEYVSSIAHLLTPGVVYYCEYLKKPKHNTLAYDRVPRNHLALFGMMDAATKLMYPDPHLYPEADRIGIDRVPVLKIGMVRSVDELTGMLDRESYLGGPKIEGVVVKNYARPMLIGGQPLPLMAGKYVSEAFKEVNNKRWKAEETRSSKQDRYFESFRTEARWAKAVQHLKEAGQLDGAPKDIGALIKEVHQDIVAEEQDAIKTWLWKEYGPQLLRRATAGLPEWYKKQVMELSFAGEDAS